MRTPRPFVLIVGFLVALLLLVLFLRFAFRGMNRGSHPGRADAKTTTVSTAADMVATPAPPSQLAEGKEARMARELARLNQQPIEFYGRVVDQYGKPVFGAEVTGSVMVQQKWMNGTETKLYTSTSEDGRFQFDGLAGRDMAIWINIAGYQFESLKQKTLFKYSLLTPESERHQPNAASPVVFTVWKLSQDLNSKISRGNALFRLTPDGRSYTIDLAHKSKRESLAEAGDFRIRISRAMPRGAGLRYDWSATIDIEGGGLIEQNAEGGYLTRAGYMNEAPAEGYIPTATIVFSEEQAGWVDSVRKVYYFKTRSAASFGKMQIEILSKYQDGSALLVDFVVNESASRNLEVPKDRK